MLLKKNIQEPSPGDLLRSRSQEPGERSEPGTRSQVQDPGAQ